MSETTLIDNVILVTLGEENKVIKNGTILTDENIVKDFGKTSELKKKALDKEIDASGKIIMPGLINTHKSGNI